MLVSSHLISEMSVMAGRLVVIGRRRLLGDGSAEELSAGASSLEEAFFALTGDSAEYRADWK